MPTPFIMPKFDMDQTSATIVEWLKREGDWVQIDEDVLVVETEKVAVEVTAPVSGILAGIRTGPGQEVPVTQIIAYILAEGETENDIPIDEMLEVKDASTPDLLPPTPSATPLAARMAKELGIDLSQLKGISGLIKKTDIEDYTAALEEFAEPSRVAATPAARRLAQQRGVDLGHVAGSGPRGRVQEEDVKNLSTSAGIGASFEGREFEILPLTPMRRTIAERMQSSFQNAPHISLTMEVDVTQFEVERSKINALRARDAEETISMTAFLVYITSRVLSRHPLANASFIDDQIYLWKELNIGVAAAVDDGLVVPVIHQAEQLTLDEINQSLGELVSKARAGKLTLSDVRSGTFTISNLGMFGIHQFQAIINPPESAILAIGAVVRKPVVIDEKDANEVRPIMSMTISADHRVLDGATTARFLSELAEAVQNPTPFSAS